MHNIINEQLYLSPKYLINQQLPYLALSYLTSSYLLNTINLQNALFKTLNVKNHQNHKLAKHSNDETWGNQGSSSLTTVFRWWSWPGSCMCQGILWFHGWRPSSLARHLTHRKVLLHTRQVHHPKEDWNLEEEKNNKKTGWRQRNTFIRHAYICIICLQMYNYLHSKLIHKYIHILMCSTVIFWVKCVICNRTNVGSSLPQIYLHWASAV